jgi:hypothetical protein
VSLAAACGGSSPTSPGGGGSTPPPTPATGFIVTAGDIAICGSPGAEATAKLLDNITGTVLVPGDLAYYHGSAQNFRDCYGPTWGRHKSRTRPVPGNHEYEQPNAQPYFDYFGSLAGPAGLGYYSFKSGEWTVLAINSNIPIEVGSAQYEWVRAELASAARCTLAFFHHPLFGSGPNAPSTFVQPLFQLLYDNGADVVINGHQHHYERFAPQTPRGVAEPERGIRQFTVGTGGADLYHFVTVRPNSEAQYSGWGVLKMSLESGAYQWEFVPVDGGFRDTGRGLCH